MDIDEDDWHEFDSATFDLSALSRVNKTNTTYPPSVAQPQRALPKVERMQENRNIVDTKSTSRIPSMSPGERYNRRENIIDQTNGQSEADPQNKKKVTSSRKFKEISIPFSAEEQGNLADSPPLPVAGTSHVSRSARGLSLHLQQAPQPPRHMQTPSRIEAISQWQASQALSIGDDADGLEIPSGCVRLTRNDLVGKPVPDFESDNEDWGEGSLGIRHASRMPRSARASTTSSMISASNTTTDLSHDGLDGIDLPDDMFDLRNRLRAGTERRAAGDTIKQTSRGYEIENPAEGLIINSDSFVKAPRTARDISQSSPRSSNLTQRVSETRSEIKLPADASSYAAQHRDPPSTTAASQRILRLTRPRQEVHHSSAQHTHTRPTGFEKSGQSKAAFLPSGPAPHSSHHVSALSKRVERVDSVQRALAGKPRTDLPFQRCVTTSDALRSEASRCITHAHIRAKTYGEGNELDDLDDLPAQRTIGRIHTRNQPVNDLKTARHPIIPWRRTQTKADPVDNTRGHLSVSKQQTHESLGNRKKNRKRHNLPGLISGINTTPVARIEKNMVYNPKTYKWEGNDQVLSHFDEAFKSPPRPALISNVRTVQPAVQIVNGMVFDPIQMSWIKIKEDDSEIDPFEHLEDLANNSTDPQLLLSGSVQSSRVNLEHFSVGEEFDVGRQFIKKQREEEAKWRTHSRGWFVGRNKCKDRTYLQDIYALLLEDD